MATKLLKRDLRSDTWTTVKTYVRERIDTLRDELEYRTNTEQTTDAKRGAIAELRKLLALENEPATAPRLADQVGRVAVEEGPSSLDGD